MWLQLKSGDFEQTYLARPIAQSTAREYCNNEDVALYSRKDGIVQYCVPATKIRKGTIARSIKCYTILPLLA